jgi:hypothetical protein
MPLKVLPFPGPMRSLRPDKQRHAMKATLTDIREVQGLILELSLHLDRLQADLDVSIENALKVPAKSQ